MSESNPSSETFAEIDELIASQAVPGCSVALDEGGSVEMRSFGNVSGLDSKEVNERTVYDLASISKLFTTALILRLHEAGRLSIDDRCADYLPYFEGSDLMLLDLLTHRVDFGVYLADLRGQHKDGAELLNALMTIQPPQHATPDIHYGNLGFIYLGKVVEKVSGTDLATNMRALFSDLNLTETYTGQDIASEGIVTPPTEVVDGQIIQGVTHDETARALGGLAGNAGIFATAADLTRFGRAWLDGRVVSQQLLHDVVLRNYDQSDLLPQAIGWWMRYVSPDGLRDLDGAYSHTGFTGSMLIINPTSDRVAAVTCNRTYLGRENVRQTEVWASVVRWAQGEEG